MTENSPLLDVLTREGVLASASVRYWRAARKLRPEDLGLDPDDVADRLISLGHKRLLPRDALKGFALIESRTHALIAASTFPFLDGIGRFLPNRRLADVSARLADLEREFETERARFMADYARLREQAIAEWRVAAARLSDDPERVVAGVLDAFPHPDRMDRYFGFSAGFYQIRLPETLETELVEAKDRENIVMARRRAAEEARRKISAGVEDFVGDCVTTLREQTARLCEEMLASFSTGKTGCHQRTLNRLADFIGRFKELNFAGDAELEAHLDNIRRKFLSAPAEEYRDNGFAMSKLRAGVEGLASAARDMAEADAREIVENFGRMGARRFNLAA